MKYLGYSIRIGFFPEIGDKNGFWLPEQVWDFSYDNTEEVIKRIKDEYLNSIRPAPDHECIIQLHKKYENYAPTGGRYEGYDPKIYEVIIPSYPKTIQANYPNETVVIPPEVTTWWVISGNDLRSFYTFKEAYSYTAMEHIGNFARANVGYQVKIVPADSNLKPVVVMEVGENYYLEETRPYIKQ